MTSTPAHPLDLAARAAYGAYAQCLGIDKTPGAKQWDDLPPQRQEAWRAVADAVQMINGLSSVAREAEVLHAEHHPGTFVPSLDSCTEHERAEYEQRVRDLRSLS